MRAVQISSFGGPEVLRPAEVERPVPGPGQVLIRVEAAGVNFAETLMREDRYHASYALPAVPGSELVGVIVERGADVTDLAVGQRVGAVLAAARVLTGGYAEYAVADAGITAQVPDGLDAPRAVAVLIQGLTALHLTRLVDPRGAAVLVTAGGGGVASLLIQLLRRAGARRVVAAASTAAKRDHALALGADATVPYDAVGAGPFDLVYDSVGGDVLRRCLAALAQRARLVVYGSLNLQRFDLTAANLWQLMTGNRSLHGFTLAAALLGGTLRQDLAELFALVASGELVAAVGAALPLARAADAHRLLAERASVGKLVLVP